MRRGDLVTIALPGDFGKPRPALVVQSDQFTSIETVTVMMVTGTLVDAPLIRVSVEASKKNNLRKRSQIMIDKTMTVKREKLGEPFGRLDDSEMLAVSRAMALFLGLA